MEQLINQITTQHNIGKTEAEAIINLLVIYAEENAPVLGNSLSYLFNRY